MAGLHGIVHQRRGDAVGGVLSAPTGGIVTRLGASVGLAWIVALAACNGLTGAGEPEVEDDATSGAGLAPGAATTTTTGAGGGAGTTSSTGTVDTSSATGAGGAGDVDPEGNGPGCGDGERAGEEECDDGNAASGDGCDEICRLECREGEAKRLSRGTCLAPSDPDDERSAEGAAAACANGGGALALLDDLDVSTLDGRVDGLHHLGAQRAEDGAFEWRDGTTIDADEVLEDQEGYDCIALSLETGTPRLQAVECDERLAYLCERDPLAGE